MILELDSGGKRHRAREGKRHSKRGEIDMNLRILIERKRNTK